ncbi:MAG: C40 family peptidase [Ignavibacteria bacterium]|nr:C40 family peptidase [Ignavibacteria bacterium]
MIKTTSGFTFLCVLIAALFSFTTFVPDSVSAYSKKVVIAKASVNNKSSRKKRRRKSKCTVASRAVGKKQAIELVKTQSERLCKLSGLEYETTADAVTGAKLHVEADGETLTDNEGMQNIEEGEELAELELEDDVPVNVDNFRTLWLSYVDDEGDNLTWAGIEKAQILDVIMDWLGTRYHYGGTVRTGIDCSAFTRMIYNTVATAELPRTAASQYTVGAPISKNADLQFGDLVFFNTRRRTYVSHVGIYLGDNLFAHSSSRYGVTISSLESTYYAKRLIGARRLDDQDVLRLASNQDSASTN